MPSQLKLAFAGTPELAVSILKSIIATASYSIDAVYTQPDKPAGRGRKIHMSAVKELALSQQLPLYQPATPLEIDRENILSEIDILIVAAYGMLLPKSILKRPRLACINVHTSLLPRWRGAAPIQRAIQAGDETTGITIMHMDEGLDTGDILLQKQCSIAMNETAGSLHDRLAVLGGEVLLEALAGMENGTLQGKKQNHELATYAHKISKAEAEIDWDMPAATIERTVRAFNPFPVAHTRLNGVQMRIWEVELLQVDSERNPPGTVVSSSTSGVDVASADGLIRIHKLQLPGKKVVSAAEFHNGHQNFSMSA